MKRNLKLITLTTISFVLMIFLAGCNKAPSKEEVIGEMINDFFDYMILEEIDPLMDMFWPGTDQYTEFYTATIGVFNDTNLNYDVEEMSFVGEGDNGLVVDTLVTVSGLDSDGTRIKQRFMYSFRFKLFTKTKYKIVELVSRYEY